MAKLNCPCGWQISSVSWPSDWIGTVVSQYESVEFPDRKVGDDEHRRELWECTQCGRIAMFTTPDGKCVWYMPEDDKYHAVTRLPETQKAGHD